MRSVPRNVCRRGEHLSRCDVCGVPYLRSALTRGRDGLLRCPVDAPGRNDLDLAMATAARATAIAQRSSQITPADGAVPDFDSDGNPSSSSSYTGPTSRRTVEDVFNNDVPTYSDPGTRNNYPGF